MRALGVESFEITETRDGLLISGLGADGAPIAQVDLRLGMYVPAMDGGPEVFGRTMRVTVMGQETFHESAGTEPVTLPLARRDARLRAALVDPQIADALARWGVTFDSTEPVPLGELATPETPYYWSSYSSSPWPQTWSYSFGGCGGGPGDAAYFEVNEGASIGEFRCCYNAKNSVERRCDPGGQPNVETECGTTGGQGCAVCWVDSYQGDCFVSSYYEFAFMQAENW